MKLAVLAALAAFAVFGQSAAPAGDSPDQEQASDLNVNSRYTIESIGFAGEQRYKLSSTALEQMQQLIGAKLNSEALDRLAERIRNELRAHDVTFKVARGGEPDSVKVLLEVEKGASKIDLAIPKFVYSSRQGWTGVGEASATLNNNALTAGLLSDGDTYTERIQGVWARYDRLGLAGGRIRAGFQFDSYHEAYNRATLDALADDSSSSLGAGAYRSRVNFEPSATFVLAKPLTLTVGAGFERLEPGFPAAHAESANAVINTLRYHQRWGDSGATCEALAQNGVRREASQTYSGARRTLCAFEELDAGYSLRAATKLLGTDLAYSRHQADLRFAYTHDRQSLEVMLVAGVIYGRAPLFERFVLGNSTTLRGWNKYDLDPVGGNRLAYGSVTYGYRIMRVFYDAGSIWDQGKTPEAKQSLGAGVSSGLGILQKGAFLLAVAFPLRQGHTDPVLIAGMNF